MVEELLPTLGEFNLVLEHGLEGFDYLHKDDWQYGQDRVQDW